ncbi:MAG: alpha-L-arabinofuranosidase C-terminal domain-containing protein, partial [Armatimonadota bacterium]
NTYAPAYKNQIKIAVTEWAPLFHILPTDKWIDHCKTLGSGIYAASTMKAFIETPNMDLANSFKLTEYGFMGWINFDGTPKPSYYALQMYTRHFGSALINTSVSSPTFNTKGVSQIDAVKDVPYLESISSLSKDKSKLYVIVINKHINSPIKGKLNLNGFTPSSKAKTWTMTAPSLDANNGEDLPQFPGLNWAKQITAPQNPMFESGKPGTVVIHQGSVSGISEKFEYTFPPISVTCIEMQKSK